MKKVIVPSFSVDHLTMNSGLYLRENRRISLFTTIKVWDLRFTAPRSHCYLSGKSMHSIEHIMAYKLRCILGDKYISFFPFGCRTGFGFISKSSLTFDELRSALITVIDHTVPLCSKTEIPCLTPEECGNPNYFSLMDASSALLEYKQVLLSLK